MKKAGRSGLEAQVEATAHDAGVPFQCAGSVPAAAFPIQLPAQCPGVQGEAAAWGEELGLLPLPLLSKMELLASAWPSSSC